MVKNRLERDLSNFCSETVYLQMCITKEFPVIVNFPSLFQPSSPGTKAFPKITYIFGIPVGRAISPTSEYLSLFYLKF